LGLEAPGVLRHHHAMKCILLSLKCWILGILLLQNVCLGAVPCRELGERSQGIPWVEASDSSLTAMVNCWGWIHARDRGPQMLRLRAIADGRLAESEGIQAVPGDFLMRALELRSRAAVLARDLSPEVRSTFEAYSSGVNAVLGSGVWHPEDTVVLILLQSFDQTRMGFAQDLREDGDLDAILGRKIDPKHPLKKWDSPIVENRADLPWDRVILESKNTNKTAFDFGVQGEPVSDPYAFLDRELGGDQKGSNNWVLSRTQSRDGAAWLANDPHLPIADPPFWHLSGIRSREGRVIWFGASVPGIPLIASGTNGKVAWGITTSYLKVSEALKVRDLDHFNAKKSLTTVTPVIWFKLGPIQAPFAFKSFEKMPSGEPLLPFEGKKSERWLLRWQGFDLVGKDLDGMFELLQSQSVADADQAIWRVGVSSFNFVFADQKGETGYRASGRIPRWSPASQALGSEWTDLKNLPTWSYLSREEMPHRKGQDTPRRPIVTANNRHWADSSALWGGRSYPQSFRAFRIEELLQDLGKASKLSELEKNQRIQCDLQAVDARFFVPQLIRILKGSKLDERSQLALNLLGSWNFEVTPDCQACSVFRRLMERAQNERGWDEARLFRLFLKLEKESVPNLEWVGAWKTLLESTANDLWDAKTAQIRHWGEVSRIVIAPDGGTDGLAGLPVHGDRNTVGPVYARWNGSGYRQSDGVSLRQIIRMGAQGPEIWFSLPGKNRMAAPESESLLSQWSTCRYQKVEWPRAKP
jgi:penicillin amidase